MSKPLCTGHTPKHPFTLTVSSFGFDMKGKINTLLTFKAHQWDKLCCVFFLFWPRGRCLQSDPVLLRRYIRYVRSLCWWSRDVCDMLWIKVRSESSMLRFKEGCCHSSFCFFSLKGNLNWGQTIQRAFIWHRLQASSIRSEEIMALTLHNWQPR